MQAMELPQEPWEIISMDFVTGLPPLRDLVTKIIYDVILVIVDLLTKYAIYIPFRKDYTTTQLASIFKDKII